MKWKWNCSKTIERIQRNCAFLSPMETLAIDRREITSRQRKYWNNFYLSLWLTCILTYHRLLSVDRLATAPIVYRERWFRKHNWLIEDRQFRKSEVWQFFFLILRMIINPYNYHRVSELSVNVIGRTHGFSNSTVFVTQNYFSCMHYRTPTTCFAARSQGVFYLYVRYRDYHSIPGTIPIILLLLHLGISLCLCYICERRKIRWLRKNRRILHRDSETISIIFNYGALIVLFYSIVPVIIELEYMVNSVKLCF